MDVRSEATTLNSRIVSADEPQASPQANGAALKTRYNLPKGVH